MKRSSFVGSGLWLECWFWPYRRQIRNELRDRSFVNLIGNALSFWVIFGYFASLGGMGWLSILLSLVHMAIVQALRVLLDYAEVALESGSDGLGTEHMQ
eukprot:5898762-Amphidinium_carterae.1